MIVNLGGNKMAKIDKEATKKFGIKVLKKDAEKTEAPKKKSWERKVEKEEKNEIESDFIRDED